MARSKFFKLEVSASYNGYTFNTGIMSGIYEMCFYKSCSFSSSSKESRHLMHYTKCMSSTEKPWQRQKHYIQLRRKENALNFYTFNRNERWEKPADFISTEIQPKRREVSVVDRCWLLIYS